MDRSSSMLTSTTPKLFRASPIISHPQLRDLLVCDSPRTLKYVDKFSIVELDLDKPRAPRQIAHLKFTPNALSSLKTDDDTTLVAAGGQDADLYLSLRQPGRSQPIWESEERLNGTINNSVLLQRHLSTSSAEPRLVVSNNDQTVKAYDVPTRAAPSDDLHNCGTWRLDTQMNYCAISPSGSTALAVGDSNRICLSHVRGSSTLTFEPIATLILPTAPSLMPPSQPTHCPAPFRDSTGTTSALPKYNTGLNISRDNPNPTALTGSFSAAFSSSGMQFAVASQEGLVAVWDVRSTRPVKIFETKPRSPMQDFLSWGSDIWTTNGTAPGWSVRCVKFGGSFEGRETLAFTEHSDYLHVVDARTFEGEETIRVPSSRPSRSHGRRRVDSRRPHRHRQMPIGPSAASGTPVNHPVAYLVQALEQDAITRAVDTVAETTADPGQEQSSDSDVLRTVESLRVNMQTLIEQLQDAQASSRDRAESALRALREAARARRVIARRSPGPDEMGAYFDELALEEVDGLPTGVRWSLRDGVIETRSLDDIQEEQGEPSVLLASRNAMQVDEQVIAADSMACDLDDQREQTQIDEDARSSDTESVFDDSDWDSEDIVNFVGDPDTRSSLDIAGLCYDPSGAHIYVANSRGIGEWNVRGADCQWFSGGRWI